MSDTLGSPDSPTRTRTRNAILRAAVAVLAQNPAAPLGDIADSAGVARSTLHRYFPDRNALIEALRAFADQQIEAANERARPADGTAADALIRLCHEYFDLWDTLMWTYMESMTECGEVSSFDEDMDPHMAALIERGYQDGTIDPTVPNAWIQQMVWSLLYTAWEFIRQGGSKHEALTLTLQSLRRLIQPLPPSGTHQR